MLLFNWAVLLSSATFAYKDIVDVHGPLPNNTRMYPWKLRSKFARPAKYNEIREPGVCKFPLEIVIVQDATASFQNAYLQMKDIQLPAMLTEVVIPFPGTTVGVVSHRDKPIAPFGNETDYCQKFELPLTSDVNALKSLYGSLVSTGGADPPENSYGALVAALQSNTPGWANPLATKIVVVATDAPPHFSNDTDIKPGMIPFSGVFDEANAPAQCLQQYYPSPEQVRASVGAREAYVVFLVFNGDYPNGSNLVRRAWSWVNSYLGQTPEFINPLAQDASDFWVKLQIALAKIQELECTPPVTPPPTLPTPTATPTSSTAPPTYPTVPSTVPTVPTTVAPTRPTTVAPTVPTTVPPCECPPCVSNPCDPCSCGDGVLIKLKYRPQKLSLVVENGVDVPIATP